MTVMITYTNRLVNIFDLSSSDIITIKDIAHSLANKCRFNGHCNMFYSVAEHSVLASRLASNDCKIHALLHDAAEAFMGDIIRPIKKEFDVFEEIECQILNYIYQCLGINLPSSDCLDEIKRIDNSLLVTEAEQLFYDMNSDDRYIWPDCKPAKITISGLYPHIAKSNFLTAYYHIEDCQKD